MEFEVEEEQSRMDSNGTSKAHMHERDSEFGDHNCGEPLLAQRLLIDFTPDEELDLDSEYNQKKCRAFWDFIKSKPELQHLMAVPEAVDYGESFTSSDYQQSECRSEAAGPVERTAISTLELAQEEGRMAPAFLGMPPQTHCPLGSRVYPEPGITGKKLKTKASKHVCSCKGSCDRCRSRTERRRRGASLAASSALAVDLCEKITKWDAEHPKSMEPPGHPPNLCTATRKHLFH